MSLDHDASKLLLVLGAAGSADDEDALARLGPGWDLERLKLARSVLVVNGMVAAPDLDRDSRLHLYGEALEMFVSAKMAQVPPDEIVTLFMSAAFAALRRNGMSAEEEATLACDLEPVFARLITRLLERLNASDRAEN